MNSKPRPLSCVFIACAVLGVTLSGRGAALTTAPGPDLVAARMAHYSAAMSDGTVMLVGGHGTGFASMSTVEHVNLATGTTASFPLQGAHDSASVVRLADGTVFIGGGAASLGIPQYDLLEIYDPATHQVLRTGHFKKFRCSAGAAVLAGGKILVVGGWWTHNDAHTYPELVDPATLESALTGPLTTARSFPYVVPLDGGGALVIGGVPPSGGAMPVSPERFDAAAGTFAPVTTIPLFQERPKLGVNFSQQQKDIVDIRLADGRYVFLGVDGELPVLFTVDGAGAAAVLAPPEALPAPATAYTWNYVVDRTRNLVHVISVRYPAGNSQADFTVTTVGADGAVLGSGSTGLLSLGYYHTFSGVTGLPDGAICLTGGHLSNNFDAVNKSLLLRVELGPSLDIQMVAAVWITGTKGATHTVEYSTKLDTTWTKLDDVLLTNSPQAYVDFSTDAAQRFYRVSLKP